MIEMVRRLLRQKSSSTGTMIALALLALLADRHLGAHVYDSATNGPILWQHLFWFLGHPEVYVLILPGMGIVAENIDERPGVDRLDPARIDQGD